MHSLRERLKTRRPSTRHLLLVACLVVASSSGLDACSVCLPFPVKSAADYLIESEIVVFAREDPDNPFSYVMVEILKGSQGFTSIDHFVDSSTRRRLKANDKHVVVFVRPSADQPWRSLGIANAEYQQIVQRILVFSTEWNGKNGSLKRSEFFLPLFGHENRTISELAYLELGRAPYSVIKKFARVISHDDLRPVLARREYLEWRSLAILLLSQNADEQDREIIESSFHGCQTFSLTTNLAAWATAYIEINGLSAVEEIDATYLSVANRTDAEVRAIIAALSVHGQESSIVRDRIRLSYANALKMYPALTPEIEKHLSAWKKRAHPETELTQANSLTTLRTDK